MVEVPRVALRRKGMYRSMSIPTAVCNGLLGLLSILGFFLLPEGSPTRPAEASTEITVQSTPLGTPPPGTLFLRTDTWGTPGVSQDVLVEATLAESTFSLTSAEILAFTDSLNSEAALATLLDDGTQGDRAADDGVFSGLINLHELEPGQTMFYVRGEATGPAQETADFGSAPAKLEFFRLPEAYLTECQGMNLGLSFLFGRDTTPSGVGPLAVQLFPSVPFLNVGFFEQLDPSRPHASCDPSGIDRLLSAFWGSQDVIIVGPLDSESAPAEDVDPDPGQDNPIKRIVDALQRIGKDNCIDANDAEDLREILDALDEIADSDTLRQFLADTDWEGSLDEGQRLLGDYLIPLIRKPIAQVLRALTYRRRDHRRRLEAPTLERICWRTEDGCTIIEVDVNRKFEITFGQSGIGLDIEFLKDSINKDRHVIKICASEETGFVMEVVSGSVRFDFDDLGGIFGTPEIPFEDFFLKKLEMPGGDKNKLIVEGWVNEVRGLGWDVKGDPFTTEYNCPNDFDCDGMPDRYEKKHSCLDETKHDAAGDPDKDGLTNLEEHTLGTDPCVKTNLPDEKGGAVSPQGRAPTTTPKHSDVRRAGVYRSGPATVEQDQPGLENTDFTVLEPPLIMEMNLYGAIPQNPPSEVAWSFFLDLDQDRSTGFPGHFPPVYFFPGLGIDVWAELAFLDGQFRSRLFIGEDGIGRGIEAQGPLQFELNEYRTKVTLSLDWEFLQGLLPLGQEGPSGLSIEEVKWGAAGRFCEDLSNCGNGAIDAYPKSEALLLEPLLFAQFANGSFGSDSLVSQFGFFATVPERTSIIQLEINDDQGLPIPIDSAPGSAQPLEIHPEGVETSLTLNISPLGLLTATTDGEGPPIIGSVLVRPDVGVDGVILLDAGSTGIAGVNATRRAEQVIVPVKSTASFLTGLALAGLGSAQELRLTLRDSQGTDRSTSGLNLALRGHDSRFLHQYDWDPPVDLSDFDGSVLIEGPAGFAAMAVIQTPRGFATLPVSVLPTPGTPLQARGQAEHVHHLAQFGDGQFNGLTVASAVTVLNLDDQQEASVTIEIRDDDGQPMTVDLNGVVVVGNTQVLIPAKGSATLATDGAGALQTGAVVVTSDAQVSAFVFYDAGSVGIAGVGSSEVGQSLITPIWSDAAVISGIAFAATGGDLELQLALRNRQGNLVSQAALELGDREHISVLVNEFDWDPVPDFGDFHGTLTVTGTGALAATSILVFKDELATLPVFKKIP